VRSVTWLTHDRGTRPSSKLCEKANQGWLLGRLDFLFGLGHADSVRNLTPGVNRALPGSSKLRRDNAAIRQELLKTERISLKDLQRFDADSGSLMIGTRSRTMP
jgi:hypothetical protein